MNISSHWQPAGGRRQQRWGRTLAVIGVLALAPVLAANDDGEIVDVSIVLTVSPDFRVKEEVSVTKVLKSYQAFDTDGDPRTLYHAGLQTLTFTRARVTTPGGKVVDCTPNAFNLSTPAALEGHPALSGWQEMVVTFLGLEPGSRTELSYIREDKVAFRTTFEKKQVLAWHFPIQKGTVVVRLPQDLPLTYQMVNVQGEATAKPVADWMEYTFAFKDIPSFSDRDLHTSEAFLPTLYLTTTPSWEAAGKRLLEIAEKYGSPDEAITQKAKELAKDATTDLDKAIAIHKYVKENFREIDWPLQDSLLFFNDVGKTFAAGQGTNLELALLMRAMLRVAKVEAKLVLAGPIPSTEQVPGLTGFDQAMVLAADIDWNPVSTPGPEPAASVLLEEGAGYRQTPAVAGVRLEGSLEWHKIEFKGTATVTLSGGLNPYWKNLEEKDALQSAAEAFLPLSELKIEDTQVKALGPEGTRLELTFSGKPQKGDRMVRLLPESKVFLPGVDPRSAASTLPVLLPELKVSIRWDIKGVEWENLPMIDLGGPWGGMRAERSVSSQGVRRVAHFFLPGGYDPWLPSTDYPALQAALAAWNNPVVAGVLLPAP